MADPNSTPAQRIKRAFQILGPGLITGASDDDPSGIGTYSQAGAQFGFGMLWVLLFTWPLMSAIQEISGRIGRTTGRGIAANLRRHYPKWFHIPIVAAVFIANVINIGADLGAMGASLKLLVGGPALLYDFIFAAICFFGAALCSYKRYANILKWLSAVLIAYVVTAFVVHVPWSQALKSTVTPNIQLNGGYIALLVGVLGTTISPYLFFWQASEEAEEVHDSKEEKALIRSPEQVSEQLHRIRIDTYLGMFFSNAVAWFIVLASAATLYAHHQNNITSAQEAAQALQPIGGKLAFYLFAAGIIGTGLLAVPILAGSAAYAVGEEMRQRVGINYSPDRAKAFYIIFGVAATLGLAFNFSPINPIEALVWTAIINGVVSVPVMFAMMLMIGNQKIMGPVAERGKWLKAAGWLATAVMAIAAVLMFATMRS